MRKTISIRARIAMLLAVCGTAVAVVSLLPRIPQDPRYHDFADQRTLLAIPNALNVLSNVPFAIVGMLGIWWVWRGTRQQFADRRERVNYLVFFFAVGATAAGSAYYHLMPNNQTLLWDRLPMSVGFMSLLAAMVAERISVRAGAWLLGPLVAAGVVSLLWWRWTEHAGRGDLRPYALVQFDGLLAVVLLLTLLAPRYTRAGLLWWAVGLYAGAKALEAADRPVWAATGHIVSGHTLKHLAASAATGCFALAIAKRQRLADAGNALRGESRSAAAPSGGARGL